MKRLLSICLISAAGFMSSALAQDSDLTQIKERELEQVREQISRLKQSMDRRATDRDRITGELQAAERILARLIAKAYLADHPELLGQNLKEQTNNEGTDHG